MSPPHIEYATPYVELKVKLPNPFYFDGKLLAHPLLPASEIRDMMVEFSEKISDLYLKGSEV